MKKHSTTLPGALFIGLMLFLNAAPALASSHRDAPLISQDPAADATDFYAFVSPDRPDTITMIADYIALEEGAVDSNNLLSDNVLYSINIDNDGDAREDIAYQFRFQTEIQNKDALLYSPGPVESLADPDFHVRQTYTLTRVEKGVSTVLGKDLPVPPVNIGPKSIPDYETVSNEAVQEVGEGIKVFVGQADDPFFVDIGSLIDGITIRKLPGNAGGGVDGIAGFNTHAFAIQVPVEQLTKTKTKITDPGDPAGVIGMWTSSYRQKTQVISGNSIAGSGDWIEVSRVGVPLTNDFFIPVAQKDFWNTTQPKDDAQFFNYVTDPGVTKTIHTLYGITMPPQGPYGSKEARTDLFALLFTGIPKLNQPNNVVPAEELRLNTAILPAAKPDRLGVLAGDNQGYPNGRRLADDVIDISLRAAAGAVYPLFGDPNFRPDPVGILIGDGVDTNDKPFRNTFPYVALPLSGYDSIPHGAQYAAPDTKVDAPPEVPAQNTTTSVPVSSTADNSGMLITVLWVVIGVLAVGCLVLVLTRNTGKRTAS